MTTTQTSVSRWTVHLKDCGLFLLFIRNIIAGRNSWSSPSQIKPRCTIASDIRNLGDMQPITSKTMHYMYDLHFTNNIICYAHGIVTVYYHHINTYHPWLPSAFSHHFLKTGIKSVKYPCAARGVVFGSLETTLRSATVFPCIPRMQYIVCRFCMVHCRAMVSGVSGLTQ